MDFDDIITEILKEQKSDSKWSNLADYYIALKYVFTMVDSYLYLEMDLAVCMQMMLTFAKIGNPHALNFGLYNIVSVKESTYTIKNLVLIQ